MQSVVVDPSRPTRGDNVKRAKLKLLAPPFPQAVAGTPTRYRFDADSSLFELTYSTAGTDGRPLPRRVQTEIRAPRINFPDGYIARVEGAAVASRRNAAVLRLKRDPGAAEVDVVVRPAVA